MSNIAGNQINGTPAILSSTGGKIAMDVQCRDLETKSQMHRSSRPSVLGRSKGAGHMVITVRDRTMCPTGRHRNMDRPLWYCALPCNGSRRLCVPEAALR
jgi:hypothetical protein